VSYNATVEDDIREALVRDPRVPSPDEVAISFADGTVVLRGTVGSFSQRRAAASDARGVAGVDVNVSDGWPTLTGEVSYQYPERRRLLRRGHPPALDGDPQRDQGNHTLTREPARAPAAVPRPITNRYRRCETRSR
jgi:hypothetical protein